MLTMTMTSNVPEINPQRAVDTFIAALPQILDAPSVKKTMEIMQIRPPLANTRGGRKNKPLTLPDHWHVELLPNDIHFFNDLPYAKYVYGPRARRIGYWPVAEKVEVDMTSDIQHDMDVIWRQANVRALFQR